MPKFIYPIWAIHHYRRVLDVKRPIYPYGWQSLCDVSFTLIGNSTSRFNKWCHRRTQGHVPGFRRNIFLNLDQVLATSWYHRFYWTELADNLATRDTRLVMMGLDSTARFRISYTGCLGSDFSAGIVADRNHAYVYRCVVVADHLGLKVAAVLTSACADVKPKAYFKCCSAISTEKLDFEIGLNTSEVLLRVKKTAF